LLRGGMIGAAPEPVILALDSAGAACSAAVAVGERLLSAVRVDSQHGQAERLLPMVDSAMREAQLPPAAIDLVVTTVGPGSFTGIRVALAAARGIALATGARLIGVTSFAAVAAGVAQPSHIGAPFILIAIESRREDLFVQIFDRRQTPLGPPAAMLPVALGEVVNAITGAAPLLIAGDAAQRAARVLAGHTGTTILEQGVPEAVGALRAALRLPPLDGADTARPLYLRPPDVTSPNCGRKPSFGRA
jgi:tRNA threonylcarbamoyladenosine biosynthesis protein TsaB